MAQEIEAATSPATLAAGERSPQGLAAFLAQLQALGPGRILALGLVAAGLLGLLAFIAFRAVEPRYALLFGGLQPADAAALVDRLEALGTPYRLNDAGDAVMVPAEEVGRLRMTLAQDGMPAGEVVGYELFDQANGFTTTDFLANVNLRRALEGELARTIASLREVRAARVHLVQPKRRLFDREAAQPSASVLLTLAGGASLDRRQVEGVRYLVASAVPGLDASRVTVMDDRGELLARAEDGSDSFLLDRTEEYRRAYEEQLRQKLVSLLERSIGPGRVDAQVTAELDFDEVAITEDIYDPQGQVVRSTRTTEESSRRNEANANGAVSVGNNLPAAGAGAAAGPTSQEQVDRNEETVNYEISRKQRTQRKRGGTVRRLFVAVQVDGTYVEDANGNRVFQPRKPEELAQLEALARSAVGIDEERGDRIEIVSRPFVQPEAVPVAEPGLLTLLIEDYGRYLESLLWLLFGTMVLLFGVRPLLARLLPAAGSPVVASGETAVILGNDGKPLLVHGASGTMVSVDERGQPVVVRGETAGSAVTAAGGAGGAVQPAEGTPENSGESEGHEGQELVNLDKVAGKVKASLVNEVADILDRYPEEAVRVIRSWLHN